MDEITCGLHWWTFTAGRDLDRVRDVMCKGGFGFGPPERRGGLGNPWRQVHESGTEVFYGSPRDDQPIVVNASGAICEGWTDQLIDWAEQIGGKVTRFDVALDLGPAEKAKRRVAEMVRAWRRRQVKTHMSPKSLREMKDRGTDGVTATFGGRTSGHLFRAYTERGPLRIEHQYRPEGDMNRRAVPGMCRKMGFPAIWRGLAAAAVFPMPWYVKLLDGEAVTWARPEDEDTSLGSVLEAMVMQYGPTFEALARLGILVDDRLRRDPGPGMRGELLAKWARWAKDAAAEGLDGRELAALVDQRKQSSGHRKDNYGND